MNIKILGTGCTKCIRLERLANETVAALAIDATIEKVEDLPTIMAYGVMSTPGLVTNGELIMSGKVPTAAQLRHLLTSSSDSPR